jgi:hypothetical protein
MMHIYQKGLLCVLPITQASKEYIWKETICTDGAHWYDEASIDGWEDVVYGCKLKNLVERFIQQQIKDRTGCFDDHLPCRKKDVIDNI